MGIEAGQGGRALTPRFSYKVGTDIVDRGLIVLFFGIFSVALLPFPEYA